MIVLKGPSPNQIRDAIDKMGDGFISDEWIASLQEIVTEWICGSVASNRYGPTNTRLQVIWSWDDGDLTVTVLRTP